ncbi:Crp/Fnr family transcriptional regulator [Flavobacterium aquidurense]|uniref:Putative transcriptional regulator, Crp/Fnr family n=1 Tax=Flavobacterium aquidurense TaxID=362413 RepID=A0A0Q0VZP9_9FLAO|nr:Crp/Fnr family transcriptional regulator [Flavobacterium aquidurense]KQB39502.1 putative transcriptional regulator, Crp/Fnr family [Flavobacterium aquidurense]
MIQNLVLQNIAKHISLDENEISYFLSILKEKKYPKKSMILKEGEICKTINFVQSGILRAFYRDQEGKESTIMFAISDWWITDMACFINQQPAILNIETIEDSLVFFLQKEDLDELYIKIPKFERFFRIIMQNAYIREQLRVIQNLSLSAEQRYYIFLEKYPQVAKQVTQKQIASYLGITPEFLSMIRANKNKQAFS